MTDDDFPNKPASGQRSSDLTPRETGNNKPGDRRREPVFTDFDEDEDYEGLERDTDYVSAYEEEESEIDEYLEPLEDNDPDDLATDWQVLGGTQEPATRPRETGKNPWAIEDSPDIGGDEADVADSTPEAAHKPGPFDDEDSEEDEALDEYEDDDEDEYDGEELDDDDPIEEWEDEDDYAIEPKEYEIAPGQSQQSWPLGLVIVGVVALVLLAAGGYGVIQQRSQTQEEIRQLQASLATAARPDEVTASREALREMEQRVAQGQASIDSLTLENRRLLDMVAGLEKQLPVQQAAMSPVAAPKPPSTPKAAPKSASAPTGASTVGKGNWFVNFSSYSQRSAAESWVKKLNPSSGNAVVAASSKDGKTFYRVRIVGLTDRAQAEKVALALQTAHGLPSLWVGTE